MASTGVVDIYLVYQFLRRLATPFTKWEAFKTGVIDKEGKVLIPKNKRTPEQQRSFKVFDVMILKLKRLLGKIPGGKSRIASYAAALWLIREYDESKSEEQILSEDVDYLKYIQYVRNERFSRFRKMIEDAPVNAMSGGGVATFDPILFKSKKNVKKRKLS
tara:strand:- start:49 stop:531 length:483 start_codon:yes stop_codon:yes gene_type:complete